MTLLSDSSGSENIIQRNTKYAVLVTSRHEDSVNLGDGIQVSDMATDEAVPLLLQRMHITDSDDVTKDAEEKVSHFDHLPLLNIQDIEEDAKSRDLETNTIMESKFVRDYTGKKMFAEAEGLNRRIGASPEDKFSCALADCYSAQAKLCRGEDDVRRLALTSAKRGRTPKTVHDTLRARDGRISQRWS